MDLTYPDELKEFAKEVRTFVRAELPVEMMARQLEAQGQQRHQSPGNRFGIEHREEICRVAGRIYLLLQQTGRRNNIYH